MITKKSNIVLVLFVVFVSISYGSRFIVDEVSARGMVLGEGYGVLGGDSGVVFKNVGCVGFEDSGVVGFYGMPFSGMTEVKMNYISFAGNYKMVEQGFGGGVWMMDVDGIYRESVILCGYSRMVKIFDKEVSFGGGLKLMGYKLDVNAEDYGNDPLIQKANKNVVDLDLGFVGRLTDFVKVGLSIRNILGSDLGVEDKDNLSREASVGVVYTLRSVSDIDFLFSIINRGSTVKFSLGVESYLGGKLGLRVGYSSDGYGIGVGFKVKKINFDYGYLISSDFIDGGGSHYASVGIKF